MPRTRLVSYREGDTVPVRDWLDSLPRKAQAKCQTYLMLLGEFGYELKRPVADYLRDGIHELRASYQGVHYRILYFFASEGRKTAEEARIVVLSHGLMKEQTVPSSEIDRAVKGKLRFEADPERHTYDPRERR